MEFDESSDDRLTELSGGHRIQLSSENDGLDIEKLRTHFNLMYQSAKIIWFEFSR